MKKYIFVCLLIFFSATINSSSENLNHDLNKNHDHGLNIDSPLINYAPWFNGVSLNVELFLEHHDKINEKSLLDIYLLMERLSGPVLLNKSDEIIFRAIKLRRQLTHELVLLRNSKQVRYFEKNLIHKFNKETKGLSDGDKRKFFYFAGLNESELNKLQNKTMSEVAGYGNSSFKKVLNIDKNKYSYQDINNQVEVLGDYSDTNFTFQQNFNLTHDNKDIKKSIHDLKTTTEKSGLIGIQLPILLDTYDIDNITGQIKHLNDVLSNRTKMSHNSLGLNGRIFWVIGESREHMVNAQMIRVSKDVRIIYSPISSYAHEWFHSLVSVISDDFLSGGVVFGSPKNNKVLKSFESLENGIRNQRIHKKDWHKLINQASYKTQEFVGNQWSKNIFAIGNNYMPSNEKGAVYFSLNYLNSKYDAVIFASHIYWLKQIKQEYHANSTWVERRELLDRMLVNAKWSEINQTIINEGYFSKPEEWLASAFQSDILMHSGYTENTKSLMSAPLPIEAEEYRKHWDRFFIEINNLI